MAQLVASGCALGGIGSSMVLRSNLKAVELELHEKYDYYKLPVEVSPADKTAPEGTTPCHLSPLYPTAWIGSLNIGV
ncbi:hypothetical protein WISP_77267 [Willisornis vidua]|uniref:Uncharacterized protein n=1 Tax=Willisornis vidua TaxID=1566151 RepID=A0ABQ9DBP7_9PASS|nr:hypothetical protein WISP_77267 [Willisornis vidua]